MKIATKERMEQKMVYTIYSIQDVLSTFGAPLIAPNEQIMKRNYRILAQQRTKEEAQDMRLFEIGKFDLETGEIIPTTPKCVEGGIDIGED